METFKNDGAAYRAIALGNFYLRHNLDVFEQLLEFFIALFFPCDFVLWINIQNESIYTVGTGGECATGLPGWLPFP